MTTITVTAVDRTGIMTDRGHLTWATMVGCCTQDDADLRAEYRAIVESAAPLVTDESRPWYDSLLNDCRLSDYRRANPRPVLSDADRAERDRIQREQDNANTRAEILDIYNRLARGEISEAAAEARGKHLRGEIY